MYLNLDVVLAELKRDAWPASEVDLAAIDSPKTSVATSIELQYAMEDEWVRDRLARGHEEIAEIGIDFLPLNATVMDAAADLRGSYEAANVFDAVHLGTARIHDEPIVSTDTLYPRIDEVEDLDPRDVDWISSNPVDVSGSRRIRARRPTVSPETGTVHDALSNEIRTQSSSDARSTRSSTRSRNDSGNSCTSPAWTRHRFA